MVKSKILVIGSKNNTFNPVTSAPANSGKVEASFIVPPAWVLSDRLGVPRIENTPGPSMSCNETNGNCLIYGGHKLNQLEEVNRTDYDIQQKIKMSNIKYLKIVFPFLVLVINSPSRIELR